MSNGSQDYLHLSEADLEAGIDALVKLHPDFPRSWHAFYVHHHYNVIQTIPVDNKALGATRGGSLKAWGEMIGLFRNLAAGTQSLGDGPQHSFDFRVGEVCKDLPKDLPKEPPAPPPARK